MTSFKGQIEKAIRVYEEGKTLQFGGEHAYGLNRKVKVLARVNYISDNLANANVSIQLPNGQRVKYTDHFYDIGSFVRCGLLESDRSIGVE